MMNIPSHPIYYIEPVPIGDLRCRDLKRTDSTGPEGIALLLRSPHLPVSRPIRTAPPRALSPDPRQLAPRGRQSATPPPRPFARRQPRRTGGTREGRARTSYSAHRTPYLAPRSPVAPAAVLAIELGNTHTHCHGSRSLGTPALPPWPLTPLHARC